MTFSGEQIIIISNYSEFVLKKDSYPSFLLSVPSGQIFATGHMRPKKHQIGKEGEEPKRWRMLKM